MHHHTWCAVCAAKCDWPRTVGRNVFRRPRALAFERKREFVPGSTSRQASFFYTAPHVTHGGIGAPDPHSICKVQSCCCIVPNGCTSLKHFPAFAFQVASSLRRQYGVNRRPFHMNPLSHTRTAPRIATSSHKGLAIIASTGVASASRNLDCP